MSTSHDNIVLIHDYYYTKWCSINYTLYNNYEYVKTTEDGKTTKKHITKDEFSAILLLIHGIKEDDHTIIYEGCNVGNSHYIELFTKEATVSVCNKEDIKCSFLKSPSENECIKLFSNLSALIKKYFE